MGMLDVQYTLGGCIYINHFVFDGNDKDGKHNLLHVTSVTFQLLMKVIPAQSSWKLKEKLNLKYKRKRFLSPNESSRLVY